MRHSDTLLTVLVIPLVLLDVSDVLFQLGSPTPLVIANTLFLVLLHVLKRD